MPIRKKALTLNPPRCRTIARLGLTTLLLLPGRLSAQTAPAPAPAFAAAAARATCETELAAGRYPQALLACQAVQRNAEKLLGPEDESVGFWLLIVGRALQEGGRYAEAVPVVQRALRIMQKVHGEHHPDVAASLNNLALLYEVQGQYAQAEPLYKRSLDISEKALGPGHPDFAQSLNNLASLYRAQGQFAQAEPLFKRSLDISEKALGPGHPDVAPSLIGLAELYQAQGQYAQAEPLYKRSLDISEKALRLGHPQVATSLNGLAELYRAQGRYAQAEPLHKRSLEIREKTLGPGHPDVGQSLNNLAGLYQAQGQYVQAEPLYERSLDLWQKALGPSHPQVAMSLNNLAGLYQAQGQYAKAEPLYKRSLDLRQRALGPGHPDVATSLSNLAGLYQAQGRYAEAEPIYKRSLELREKTLRPGHPDVATALNNLALVYKAQGQYEQAESLYKRSWHLLESALGPEHPDVATSIHNLASLYRTQGQYTRAEPLYKRSLDLRERALGASHRDVATSLNNLASLYQDQGQYAQAEPLCQRSLDIREKALGPSHPETAQSLNNLASLYEDQGQHARAEQLYKRSLDLRENALGPSHPDVAASLNNVAALYLAQGQVAQAEPLIKRSLDIREKALGPSHPDVAESLNNLAMVHQAQGQHEQAEPLYKRSLAIFEKVQPATHPKIILILGNLAQLYLSGETPSLALPHLLKLFDRSLQRDGLYTTYSLWPIAQLARLHVHLNHPSDTTALYDRFLSLLLSSPALQQPLSTDLANRLSTLLERAFFHSWLRRDYARAEKFVAQVRGLAVARQSAVAATLARMQSVLEGTPAAQRRVLSLHARMSRDKVDDHARRLFGAAIQEVAAEQVEEAARLLTEGLYLSEQHLRRRLGEAEVRAWLEVQRPYLELSFELARQHPGSAALRRLAWLASLLSKGRSLDAETNKLRVLRSEGTMQRHAALALRLNTLSGQAQKLALGGQGGLALVDARQQQKQTEDLLLASMGELRVESLPEAWEVLRRVSNALPNDAVLVDYVDYVAPALGDGGGEGTRRYLALLLWPGAAGERTQVVDLGVVATHQPAIERLLRELRSPTSKPQAAAKDVYQRLLAPVVKAAGATGTLYVVPDGALSLIPFDALVDEQGTYVLDGKLGIRYLASGRDLLREYGAASGRAPLVLGDPDLQAAQAAAPAPSAKGPAAPGKGTRGDVSRAASLYASVSSLEQLAHARAEAEALGKTLYVTPLLGSSASEPRLREEAKAGMGPKILHLAMHGLFPDEALGPLGRGARSRIVPVDASLVPSAAPLPAGDALDPMLHSALVLAGAKRAQAEGDSQSDGVLTADEARTLSLEGTELTVLSACQTALGSLRGGNGVDGLRRAFLIAGSEAVVASLWRVSDPDTRSLMTLYYERLIDQKRPRITALREAMQAMKRDRPHPYYWAPFVAIGRDAPLRPLGHVVPAAEGGK